MTFEAYLQELANPAATIAATKLARLSDLGPEEASLFRNVWPGLDAGRRRSLIPQLTELAEDNVELNFDAVFLMALADSDAQVRREAIQGLWEHDGRDLIDSLVGLLDGDPDASVRAEAALALGCFVLQAELDTLRPHDSARVEEALRRSVSNKREVLEVRARALESIGARSKPWVRDLIQAARDSADRQLWLSAIHAMGRSCDATWLPHLYTELESDDAEMRFEAAVACGAIGEEAAMPYLLPLLGDEDSEVQEAAIGAVGEIGGGQAKEALERLVEDGDDRVREAALAALTEVDVAEDPLEFRVEG